MPRGFRYWFLAMERNTSARDFGSRSADVEPHLDRDERVSARLSTPLSNSCGSPRRTGERPIPPHSTRETRQSPRLVASVIDDPSHSTQVVVELL